MPVNRDTRSQASSRWRLTSIVGIRPCRRSRGARDAWRTTDLAEELGRRSTAMRMLFTELERHVANPRSRPASRRPCRRITCPVLDQARTTDGTIGQVNESRLAPMSNCSTERTAGTRRIAISDGGRAVVRFIDRIVQTA